MATLHYLFYQCQNDECGIRFPAKDGELVDERCPLCKAKMTQETGINVEQEASDRLQGSAGYVEGAILDNIRSAWNVGSMFRTADGTGIKKIYICGITPTPKHPQVSRTALGAENAISWKYESNTVKLANSLISTGYRLWVLEDTPKSINLYDVDYTMLTMPIVLVVGNEVCGVDPALMELSECMLSIPMLGQKRSYNVAVAFGIAASYLSYCQSLSQGSTNKLPST